MKNVFTATIAHTKGGVGKSTVAWNLAIALKAMNKKVIIGDLDFQQTIYLSNEIRKNTAVHEALDVHTLDDDLLDVSAVDYDLVLYDIGGFDSELNREAIIEADIVIVPISISTTEVMGFETFNAILEDLEVDKSKVRILLNNIHPRATKFNEIEAALSQYKFLNSSIRTKKDFKNSLSYGEGVVEGYSKSCSDDIFALANEILKFKD